MIIHVSTLSLPPPACFLGPGNFSSFLHLCLSFLSNLIGTTGLDFTYGQYHVFAFLFLTQGLFFPCHTGHRIRLGAGRWRGRGICRRGTQSLRCSRTNRAPQKSPRSPGHRSSGNPLRLNGPAPLFAAVTLAKARTWCPRIWVLFWHSGHLHRDTVSSGRPDSGAPSGTCRQKMLGFPGAARLRSRNTAVLHRHAHPPDSLLGLRTPGRTEAKILPRNAGSEPCDLRTWRPSRSPRSGCPSSSSPAPPSGGSLSGGAGAHWPPGPPGLRPRQTRFSWKTRCSQGRQASVEGGGSISGDARERIESKVSPGLQTPVSRGKPWPWVGVGAACL